MEPELDYLLVLKALQEIPFGVGKKLLIDFLRGEESNKSIDKNKLYNLPGYGSMAYSKEELGQMIDSLITNSMIQMVSLPGNRFWKVMELTEKGLLEISEPTLYKKKLSYSYEAIETEITDRDREVFAAFGDFLDRYNDEQKKAIICSKSHVLCIAGAGSGKTTVLAKRIEYLVRYRSVEQQKILAITFTRKARQEMMKRLPDFHEVQIETFNSFCEKVLRKHNDKVYDRPVRVVTYRDKVMMLNRALSSLGFDMRKAIDAYFSPAQKRSKTSEQLARIFLNDCFFLRDHFKFKNTPIEESAFDIADTRHTASARMMFGICSYIDAYMRKNGLRDFADQLMDAIAFFEAHPAEVPKFDHVLVDEYQDVNSTQIMLIDILSPKNLFCVGDPRQSIFGWRGSDIRHIIAFGDKYHGSETVTLKRNYRSTTPIVSLINESIRKMGLADLEADAEGEKDIKLLGFDTESAEFEFVMQAISASKLPGSEIFVLARTNRQLNELSALMKQRKIPHIIRSDELKRSVSAAKDDVTLATIHAIKGMEADAVFVIGCTSNNFPCRGSEHPVVEMIKMDEYDKEEEEKRLFYVAMSRARKSLYLSYHGKSHTSFITEGMSDIIEGKVDKQEFSVVRSNDLLARLKGWRKHLSEKTGLPAYCILHDKTLNYIAMEMPLTRADLERIHGLGPAKIMKYGDEILKIVCS
ncbi:AAA family ATPase [Candidatus Woesearchaeota archaeon]|nr:AAA family ATPase [Candidatus Woesearchaeota archaeon]